jgi:RNA polymerase sigma-70 factor (ECF subfamily)
VHQLSTDADLWHRLRDADECALAALYERHADAVYNFAFRRTSSWSIAEDVVQATFMAVWRRARAGSLDPLRLETCRPLLLYMAGNEASNARRSRLRHEALVERIGAPGDVGDHAAEVAERLDDEERMRRLRRAVDKLPSAMRDALELVVWSEVSVADAAKVLGVPEGTLKSRLSRARAKLTRLLEEDR